jgi:hypothetical protein
MNTEDTNYKRNHKDELFRFIFDNKEAALSLYNAVNESDYQDSTLLEMYTMKDFLYMGMKNDLSFLIDWNLNIFEHQSTYNPNMPLRGFIYTGSALRKYVELNKMDIYSSKRLEIPVPRYYVFYNGQRDMADEVILRLTDSMHGDDATEKSSAEFTARMVNINAGHSPKIMERSPLLYQYSLFVARLREHIAGGLSLGDAIEATVDECIRDGILEDILRANRAEVTNMLFREYDSAAHIASEKDISYEEGRLDERKNTEREKSRADSEKQRADELEIETLILASHAQGKSKEEISLLTNKPLEDIEKVLSKYQL